MREKLKPEFVGSKTVTIQYSIHWWCTQGRSFPNGWYNSGEFTCLKKLMEKQHKINIYTYQRTEGDMEPIIVYEQNKIFTSDSDD